MTLIGPSLLLLLLGRLASCQPTVAIKSGALCSAKRKKQKSGMYAPAAWQIPRGLQVAVGQQHRVGAFVSLYACGVFCHDIRPVIEVGDATKAFCLALSAENARALVQALQ